MMKSHSLAPILTLSAALLLAACGDKAPESVSEPAADKPASPVQAVDEDSFVDRDTLKSLRGKGCDLLPLAEIAKLASKPEAEIQVIKIMGCQYSWPKDNAEEIKASNEALVAEGLKNGLSIIEIGKQQESTENTVSLYVDTFFASEDKDWLDTHFRTSTNMLTAEEKALQQDAISKALDNTGTVDGAEDMTESQKKIAKGMLDVIQKESEKESFEMIDGVGARAAWSDYSNKLVVQHRNLFFNLNVDLGDDTKSLSAAQTLAASVISNIDSEL
jgi:hypothetical protein